MFNLANFITSLNLICGIFAILFAFMGRIDLAPMMIFAGAIFDFLDGFVARKLGQQGEMGKQLDSLADMVTFGVAPGVIMMVVMTMSVHSFVRAPYYEVIHYDFIIHLESLLNGSWNDFTPFIALFIPFFALFRLAKFNIDDRQTDRFIGLPTPAATLFFMSFPLVLVYPEWAPSFVMENLHILFDEITLSIVIVVISLMMVLPLPLFSLKFKTFGFQENSVRYIFLLISIGLIVLFGSFSIALIVFLYLLISLVENATTKNKKNEIQS